ncbi:porin [Paraburkholderia sp.]|uniref:porin n=1 Tax=Paraburkholderia sp. TaxID=1926495 RepID=UPI00238862E1|nr:porin [Paraburkholderia sp.]MDE1180822.1 porin [Paraburkholderia sp.]
MTKTKAFGALATVAAASLSSSAFAQSSVTLYGLIDVGLSYTSNAQTGRTNGALTGASQYSFQDAATSGVTGSRWGIRGSEDLGGGNAAIFTLENGFSGGNGTIALGGAEFARQAFVGLKSNTLGTITAGRQYDAVDMFVQPFAAVATWGGYMVSHPGDVDNLANTRRSNNSIRYLSPSYNGLSFGGVYSVGGVAGSVTQKQIYSLGAAYAQGPLSVAVAYLNARDPNFSFYGSQANAGTTAASNNLGGVGSATTAQSVPTIAGYASAKTLQIIATGASYKVGAATFNVVYTNTQFKHLGNLADGPNPFNYSGNATFNSAEASMSYRFSPAWSAGASYDYTHNSGASNRGSATYHLLATGADYTLSRLTDIYGVLVYEHAAGTDSLGQPAVAALTGQTPSASNHQLGVHISLRHRF